MHFLASTTATLPLHVHVLTIALVLAVSPYITTDITTTATLSTAHSRAKDHGSVHRLARVVCLSAAWSMGFVDQLSIIVYTARWTFPSSSSSSSSYCSSFSATISLQATDILSFSFSSSTWLPITSEGSPGLNAGGKTPTCYWVRGRCVQVVKKTELLVHLLMCFGNCFEVCLCRLYRCGGRSPRCLHMHTCIFCLCMHMYMMSQKGGHQGLWICFVQQ